MSNMAQPQAAGTSAIVAWWPAAPTPSPSPTAISITGLTPGHRYAAQIFEPFWNNNWATTFTGGANTSAGPAQPPAPDSRAPQYVTGAFLCDGDSETIGVGSSTSYQIFAAIQVRDLGPPPAS